MADQELFDGEPRTNIEDTENIAFRAANPASEGSRIISWLNFKKILKGAFVALVGDQAIEGIKTFNSSPKVPDPSSDLDAVNLRTLNNSKGVNILQSQIDLSSDLDADPGIGKLRFNNFDQSAVTAIYINNSEFDEGSIKDFISVLKQGAVIGLKYRADRTIWVNYEVIDVVEEVGYLSVSVNLTNKGGDFENEQVVNISILSSAFLQSQPWLEGEYKHITTVTSSNGLYVLSENTPLPFNSTDFDAEVINGDWVDIGGIEDSVDLVISDPSEESFTGIGTTQQAVNIDTVQNLQTIYNLIAELTQASAYAKADPVDQIATTTETTLSISKLAEPTDPSIIDIDELNNLILIKQPNTYEFVTTLVVENTSNTDRNLIIKTRDVAHGDVVITDRTISVDRNSTRTLTTIVPSFEVLSGDEPINLRITTQTGASTLIVRGLETILKTVGGAAVSGGRASFAESSNSAIRTITDYTNGVDVFNYANTFLYQFNSSSLVVDDDDTVLKPDDILIADPGRWVKVQEFLNVSNGITQTLQTIDASSGTITLDFNNRNQLVGTNREDIAANTAITYTNTANALFATFKVAITNSAILTLDIVGYTVKSEAGGNVLDLGNGNYTISMYFTGTDIEVLTGPNVS